MTAQLTASWCNGWVYCCAATTLAHLGQEISPMAASCNMTLLEVFQAVREVAADEQETLATMVYLLTSGQVRLSDEAIRAMQDLLATANVAA
jgi:hypothetical protein